MADQDRNKPGRAPGVQGAAQPGVMGDGTEEQNLNQPGNPDARIKQDEVEAAFGQQSDRKGGPKGRTSKR
ncbi:MAG TPA: hypothetical protein VD978_12705 [Azospirillum sp.]|nr:hypothetical protein [Azospirillum sp.]